MVSSAPTRAPAFPRYDSRWQDIKQGETLTLTHNIGGNPHNYLVDLQFTGSRGLNQIRTGAIGEIQEAYLNLGGEAPHVRRAAKQGFRRAGKTK